MKTLKTPLLLIAFSFTLAMVSHNALAQFPPDEEDPVNAPIDGGVSLLIAAGVAYGAKKAHEHRKKQREVEQDKLKM